MPAARQLPLPGTLPRSFGDLGGEHLSAGLTGLPGLAAYRAVGFAVAPGDPWLHCLWALAGMT